MDDLSVSSLSELLPFNHLDDISFYAVLYELSHGPLNYNIDRVETLVFNPLEDLNLVIDNFPITDHDPDQNFYTCSPPASKYVVESEIRDLASDPQKSFNFSFLHLNCRSLLGNFDRFKTLTANLDTTFSIIGLSETWLNDKTFNQVDLPGYDFISNHRINKAGGGVGLYLQDHFQYKQIGNCTVSNPEVIESLFVEIINPNGKNSIVGTIYRPPNQNIASFLEEINKIL